MRNAIADVMVAHNTDTKPGMIRVEIEIEEIETDITMRKEYDTHSRDTNNRGRSSLTTSRSEECSAIQATFDYCDVRIKDQQAAKSDYSDLLGHSSGNNYASRDTGHRYGTNSAFKVQVFNSTPTNRNLPPSTHKDRISGLATWSFQASVTPAGDIRLVQSKDSSYERTSGCDRDCSFHSLRWQRF